MTLDRPVPGTATVMRPVNMHMPKIVGGLILTVSITGRRRTAFRVWLGTRIILLAALVIGCNIEIEGPE